MSALILYQNRLADAVVTASSSRSGYAVANAYDWRTTTYWSPVSAVGAHSLTAVFGSTVYADAFAIYRHNLYERDASVVLQYSTNSGTTWIDCFAPVRPSKNQCVLKTFSQKAATHWRVLINQTAAGELFVGVTAFGLPLITERGMSAGFTVPRLGRKNEILNNKTEGGAFSGRSLISRGAETRIEIRHVSPAWVSNFWEPFVQHAELRPFFFSWDNDGHPEDAVFCWADGDIPQVPYDDNHRMTPAMPVQCLLSGDF